MTLISRKNGLNKKSKLLQTKMYDLRINEPFNKPLLKPCTTFVVDYFIFKGNGAKTRLVFCLT
jgi:hypothetical protein